MTKEAIGDGLGVGGVAFSSILSTIGPYFLVRRLCSRRSKTLIFQSFLLFFRVRGALLNV